MPIIRVDPPQASNPTQGDNMPRIIVLPEPPEGLAAPFVLTDLQKVTLPIQPADAAGNPATVEGIVWSVSDPTLLSVVPAADGLSAVVTTVGPLGTSQVNVSADALIGEGTDTITGTLTVTVVGSQATGFSIATGVPEAK